MGYSPPKCTCNGNQTHSRKYMILLEYLHDMDENVTHPFPLLEPSLTRSLMYKPSVRKHCFQNKRFLFSKTYYRVSVKSFGQPSEVNCWVIFRNNHGPLRRELLDNSPKQFFKKSFLKFLSQPFSFFLSCHALTPINLGCPGSYEMHYSIFIQHMPIYPQNPHTNHMLFIHGNNIKISSHGLINNLISNGSHTIIFHIIQTLC